MCGIVGALVFKGNDFSITDTYINGMRDAMKHRGPDGAGIWIAENKRVGMGHRRLSIIDLSDHASQPMCNEDGTLWISFNGEIYNHASIRAELEQIGGHRWKTSHSDTEVILHAFEQWGIKCLEKFWGMFAISIWDSKSRELWLIRDRIGIKPLYYSIHNGRITFASEIKALLKDPDQKRAVNEESFYHYLSFLTSPPPQTLFMGINKLAGGTWLRVSEDGSLYEHRYWDVLDNTTPIKGISDEEIAQLVLDELRTSVSLRKVSDVPVGVFLSGGIDSSTNVALFAEAEGRPVKTFTVGYQGNYQTYQNELDDARIMAARVGAEHHECLLNVNDLMDFLPKMVYLQDEPIADPVCVPLYYISKLARDNGIIVCQVGEGADELFWGYPGWKFMLQLQRYDNLPVPRMLKHMSLTVLRTLKKQDTSYYEWLRRGALGQPVFWGGTDVFTVEQKQRLLSPRLRKKFHGFTSWDVIKSFYDNYQNKSWEKSPLGWMSYFDLNLRLPELMLMRVDKMSMGASLEGREPFLDHKLVELAMSIPQSQKTKNGILKYVLKKAVRGLIPDEVIDRKKQGFSVPISEWFFDRLGERARIELNFFLDHSDFLDRKEVMKLIDEGKGWRVWYLLNFALWWKDTVLENKSIDS